MDNQLVRNFSTYLVLAYALGCQSMSAYADSNETLESEISELLMRSSVALEDRDFASALDHLQHAQHLMHREEGVLSIRQLPILEHIANSYLAQGHLKEANKVMEFYFHITQQQPTNDSAKASAAAWRNLGAWYQDTLQPRRSQRAFKTALALIDGNDDAKALALNIRVGMLKNDYLMIKCCDLSKLDEITTDLQLNSSQWLELGDLASLAEKPDQAKAFYARSEANLPPTPIGVRRIDRMVGSYLEAIHSRSLRHQTLSTYEMSPLKLVGSPLPMCASRIADLAGRRDYSNYALSINMEIDDAGAVNHVRFAKTNAPIRIQKLLREQLLGIRYRPMLKQGHPQATEIAFTQTFDRLSFKGPAENRTATSLGCVAIAQRLEDRQLIAEVM